MVPAAQRQSQLPAASVLKLKILQTSGHILIKQMVFGLWPEQPPAVAPTVAAAGTERAPLIEEFAESP